MNMVPAKTYPIPEIEGSSNPIKPLKVGFSFVLKDWKIKTILVLALIAGVATFFITDNNLEKALTVVGSIIGISGIWLAYNSLSMSYEQQIASMVQKERHQQELALQRHQQHAEMLDFYKKKASLDTITEWYKEFMQKSFVARNFRISYMNGAGTVDYEKIKRAIMKAEEEEIELLKKKGEGGDLSDIPEEKLLIRKNIIPILNYFEKISIGVLNDGVDEESLKSYFYDSFIVYQQAFLPLIEMRRASSHNGTPAAFDNYLAVVARWRISPPQKPK